MTDEDKADNAGSGSASSVPPPTIDAVIKQCEELKSTQIAVSLRLSSLLRLREITSDQQVDVDALKLQLAHVKDALSVLSPLLPVVSSPVLRLTGPEGVPPVATGTSKVITKFPADIVDFVQGTTIIPQWFDHTETVLETFNFPDENYVRCLLKQTARSPSIMKWVKTNIFDAKLTWERAKVVFANKYEIVCAEERHLDTLWDISYKKTVTTFDFMSQIETLCKEAGLDHDQFWVVSYALKKMDPTVSSLVRFGKKPRVKLSWSGLHEAVVNAEHNISSGVVVPFRNLGCDGPDDRARMGENADQTRVQQPQDHVDRKSFITDKKNLATKKGREDAKKEREERWLAKTTCHTCGEIGHISPTCPQNQESPDVGVVPQLLASSDPAVDEVDQELRELCGLPISGQFMVSSASNEVCCS